MSAGIVFAEGVAYWRDGEEVLVATERLLHAAHDISPHRVVLVPVEREHLRLARHLAHLVLAVLQEQLVNYRIDSDMLAIQFVHRLHDHALERWPS